MRSIFLSANPFNLVKRRYTVYTVTTEDRSATLDKNINVGKTYSLQLWE